jgi:hypothetical protein
VDAAGALVFAGVGLVALLIQPRTRDAGAAQRAPMSAQLDDQQRAAMSAQLDAQQRALELEHSERARVEARIRTLEQQLEGAREQATQWAARAAEVEKRQRAHVRAAQLDANTPAAAAPPPSTTPSEKIGSGAAEDPLAGLNSDLE